jgi:hypothetical protein
VHEVELSHQRMPHPHDLADAPAAHLVPGPQSPELLALLRQLADQRGQVCVLGTLAGVPPQNAGDHRSRAVRFGEPVAHFRREEDQPGRVPLPGRHLSPVPEDGGGEPVPSEDVQTAADDVGGNAERVQEVLDAGP